MIKGAKIFNFAIIPLVAVSLILPDTSYAAVPTVTTTGSAFITPTMAEVEGYINTNGEYTWAWVEYGKGTVIDRTSQKQDMPGAQARELSIKISGLEPNQQYSYRFAAKNNSGIRRGAIYNFTTPETGFTTQTNPGSGSGLTPTPTPTPAVQGPSIYTNGASGIQPGQVTLSGSVNPNGLPTTVWFEYGTTSNLGRSTPKRNVGNGYQWLLVTETVSDLSPSQPYYYRFVAQSNAGINYGSTSNFTTSSGSAVAGVTMSPTPRPATTPSPAPKKTTATTNTSGNGTGGQTGQNGGLFDTGFIEINTAKNNDENSLLILNTKGKAKAGEEIDFAIFYNNYSNQRLHKAELKAILPPETTLLSSTHQSEIVLGNMVVFNLGDVEPGQEDTITLRVKIHEDAPQNKNIIFSSVFEYENGGVRRSVTAYLQLLIDGIVVAGTTNPFFSLISRYINFITGLILALVALAVFLYYRYRIIGEDNQEFVVTENKEEKKTVITEHKENVPHIEKVPSIEEVPMVGGVRLPVVK